jgi:hypothetical protein
MSKQIYYLDRPCKTIIVGTTADKLGKSYTSEITVRDERLVWSIKVLRRFGGQDYKLIGWRMIKNGREVAIPLWIKNNLDLR